MTITLPNTYDNTELYAAGGVAAGKPIGPTPIQTIANNNNFMYKYFRGPVAHCIFGDKPAGAQTGITLWTDVWEDLAVFVLPGDVSSRPLQMLIEYAHTEASSLPGYYRILSQGSVLETLGPITAGSLGTATINFDAPSTSTRDLVLQVKNYYMKTASVLVYRRTMEDSDTAAAKADPFFWMIPTTDRLGSGEPLTDELLNRGTNNINNMVAAQRHALACVTMPIKSETTIWDPPSHVEYLQNSAYPIGKAGTPPADPKIQLPYSIFQFTVRYEQTVSVFSYFRAESPVTLNVQLSGNVGITGISPNIAAVPTTGQTYSFTENQVFLEKGSYLAKVYFDDPTGAYSKVSRLYNLTIVGE
jgi:hypothetical protein